MADVEYDAFEGVDRRATEGAGGAQRIVNMAASAVSLALIAGIGVWGYHLAVRDATGVPVVQALEGPMRIAPEEPGGSVAAHMGLAVNDVAADGVAAPPPDQIVLAPRPLDLTEEDAPGVVATMTPPVSARSADRPGLALDLVPEPAPMTQEEAVMLALAEAGVEGAIPLSGELDAAGAAGDQTHLVRASLPSGTIHSSVRPLQRPERGGAAVPAVLDGSTDVTPVPASLVTEMDADTIPAGTRMVQLGAFDSVEAARAEWDKLAFRFTGLMDDKARVVQAATSGGRAFWRLRAHGFDSEVEARRFCSALLSEQAACIPVTQR